MRALILWKRRTMQLHRPSVMGIHRWRRLLKDILPATALAIALIAHPATSSLQCNLEALRVQLRWLPQAQFAGFDVVQDHELVQKQGLDVTLEPGGPSVNGLQRLLDGEVEKAVGWSSDALDLRRQGGDVVNIAQLLQRPGTLLVCNADSGVTKANDLAGKRVGTWEIADQFETLQWPVLAAMVVCWCTVFSCRQLVVRHNLRSWRPGL